MREVLDMYDIKRLVEEINVTNMKAWPSLFIYDILDKVADEEELTKEELEEAYAHYLWLIENKLFDSIEFEELKRIFT